MQCEITAIYTYPVKSCQANSMDRVELSRLGIQGDRQLMIVKDGEFANQKKYPQLARVVARRTGPTEIEFSCKGLEALRHTVTADGDSHTTELYGSPIEVVHQGKALGDWLSSATGVKLDLVAPTAVFKRLLPVPQLAGLDGLDHTGFVDVAPVLLTNEASLEDLNSRLASPVGMDRFRPNIVVRGLDAWAEDTIEKYGKDGLTLRSQAECERCAVTCTDQQTGERFGEPLRTLGTFRKKEDGYSSGIVFGRYLSIDGQGTLAVGDMLAL